MRNHATHSIETLKPGWMGPAAVHLIPPALHMVTPIELEEMRDALAKGRLPSDLETKLRRLAQGTLLHCAVEQNCRLFASLLLAAEHSSFNDASRVELEWLLRVLAYVRKEDDAIADFKPDGFVDDQQQVRAAATDMAELLQRFKTWRLRTQVPDLWS